MLHSRIEKGLYWDKAWKLIEGCRKVSSGCDNCWSEKETAMRHSHPSQAIHERAHAVLWESPHGDGTVEKGFAGNILVRSDNLSLPLRTRKPTVFAIWNDLFHEDVPDAFLDQAYAAMALCPQHVFLVLTKRAERMAQYFGTNDVAIEIMSAVHRLGAGVTAENGPASFGHYHYRGNHQWQLDWPLPNVWHGVTCENQQTADQRIPFLLQVPGKRFLSLEPMLGPVDLRAYLECHVEQHWIQSRCTCPVIHGIVLGGESGPNARPLQMDWVRAVRDAASESATPFFFKQGSGARPEKLPDLDGRRHSELPWAREEI